ncbi:MAG: hypothetical protein J6A67_00395 [Clostridia bacterium]|nr:hypothetical protein [Clostridia bacterium]
MNKNVLIRIVSLTLVGGILLTAFGCKKDDTDGDPATSSQSETMGIIEQPTVENGTAVIEYPSTKPNGSTVVVSTVATGIDFANQFRTGKKLDKLDQVKKDRFVERCADFGIDSAKAKELVKNGTTWMEFSVDLYIANTTSKDVALKTLKAENTKHIIVDTQLGSEYGIPSGKGMYVSVDGIVDSSKYEAEEEILAALQKMGIKLAYTTLKNSADSVDDWSKVTTAYMPVKF